MKANYNAFVMVFFTRAINILVDAINKQLPVRILSLHKNAMIKNLVLRLF